MTRFWAMACLIQFVVLLLQSAGVCRWLAVGVLVFDVVQLCLACRQAERLVVSTFRPERQR